MAETAKEKTRKRKLLRSSPKVPKQSQQLTGPDEYATFKKALQKVLTVSHKQMQEKLKRTSASRASTSEG
jgi:hypothetical protein